ncbi:RnfABCDGE type electron transport complex subunit D [Mycoplasmatota bacterium]|nr:RnfABCDGE type electron transport complex subunit D [Mycoplasmatota bacterium]
MEFVKQTSPYIRKEDSNTKRMMIDVLIALSPVVIFAFYRFGWDAVIRLALNLVIMIGLEAVAFGMMHKAKGNTRKEKLKSRFQTYTINNVTAPAVSAVIYTMVIPSKLPIYAVVVGAVFAIVVVKMLFGGLGSNIFNIAAAGRRFISIALAGMFASAYADVDMVAGATALSALKSGAGFPDVLNSYPISDLFFGFIPGTMGEVSAIPILIGLAYLLIRKTADYRIVLSTALTFLVLISLVGIFKYDDNWFNFVLYNLFSGGLLFGVTFMATDPVTAPVTRPGRLIYGLIIGTFVVLIRTWGSYAEGVASSLLFANIFVPLIDYPSWAKNKYTWKFAGIFAGVFVLIAVFVSLAAGGVFA